MLNDVLLTIRHFFFYAQRIGIGWWLAALSVGIVSAATYRYTHKNKDLERMRAVAVGLFGTYLVVLFAAAVFTRTPKEEILGINLG